MKFNRNISIQNAIISDDSPTFFIAEAGVNHNGDMALAKSFVDVAVKAGADAVKFQSFKTEHLILKNIEKAPYQQETTDAQESQFDMLKRLEMPNSFAQELKAYCDDNNIIFLTTPFDEWSLDDIDSLNLPAYKIASTDLTNLPFLEKVAQKGKPIFLSTGMSYLEEVQAAMNAIHPYNQDVVLLQCTANYPIRDDEVNLNVINTFKTTFDCLLGYSDHTVGIGAAPFAIPMGAKVIEKHFTVDKSMDGPDQAASLSPEQLVECVALIRKVDLFMGSSLKEPTASEQLTRKSLQKCFVARTPIQEGDVFSDENIIGKRTNGEGISPVHYKKVFGQKATRSFDIDDIVSL